MTEEMRSDVHAGEVVEQTKTAMHTLNPRAAVLEGVLPCGYLAPDGSLHTEYVVREMGGKEEDLLAARGPWTGRITQVLLNCTVRIGDIESREALGKTSREMTTTDRMLLVLSLRRISLGDKYDMKIACPNRECRKEKSYTVDLSQLEVRAMPDRHKRQFVDVMPSGRQVSWHVMMMPDEEFTERKRKTSEDMSMTLMIAARIDAIDGVFVDRGKGFDAAMSMVQELSMRDRNHLRALFDEREAYLDDQLEFMCPYCEYVWKSRLDISQMGFFYPSAASDR
jgi:hypothetical protein